MLICDTSALFALFDGDSEHHTDVMSCVQSNDGPLIVSPYVLAELDYLVTRQQGVSVELRLLAELASSAWELAHFGATDVRAARAVIQRYRDQEIGLTDASLVVLAERYGTDRILTLDRRHFRVLRAVGGGPFTLLPE
ncbi:MAG: PIN domain-containing protein [Solirubrobacteraceae bacterium]